MRGASVTFQFPARALSRAIVAMTAFGLVCGLVAVPGRAADYQLTDEEKALDCRKTLGRMKVRILQYRAIADRAPTTNLSRTAQSVVTPVLGGPKYGIDQKAERQGDIAFLEAYNRQLVTKGCTPLDIKGELNGVSTPSGGKPVAGNKPTKAPPAAAAPSKP